MCSSRSVAVKGLKWPKIVLHVDKASKRVCCESTPSSTTSWKVWAKHLSEGSDASHKVFAIFIALSSSIKWTLSVLFSQWFNMLLYTTPKYSPVWEFYNINIKSCTWKRADLLANNFIRQCAVRLSIEQLPTLALQASVIKLKYCMLFLQFQISPMTLLQHVLLAISSWLSISYMGDCTWAQAPAITIQNLYLFSKWERLIVSAVISITNSWTYHCLYPTDDLLSCTSISNRRLLVLNTFSCFFFYSFSRCSVCVCWYSL